jgi:hypothetical protein
VDVRLIAIALTDEYRRRGDIGQVALDDMGRISDAAAAGTFTRHLREARDRGVLPQGAERIADELNQTRDNFLHWNRTRGFRAMYRGHDVTTNEGFAMCMEDVHEFDSLVPFPALL